MEFHDWIERKFIEWRGDTRKNVTQFAAYLDVSQPTVSAWINHSRGQPTTPKIINMLALKLGPEIYDILGMTRPGQLDPELQELIDNWPNLSEARRESILATAREAEPAAETKRLSPGLNPLK